MYTSVLFVSLIVSNTKYICLIKVKTQRRLKQIVFRPLETLKNCGLQVKVKVLFIKGMSVKVKCVYCLIMDFFEH